MTDSEHWARYYQVTVDRPAWPTVRFAIERFAAEPVARPDAGRRFAVDLGCGAGRDARELLSAGCRVLAIDREPGAIAVLEAATPHELRPALAGQVTDLADVAIPACDLVNASLCLPFLTPEPYWATLDGFEVEHWSEREEETQTALGEPHHLHLVELVARRVARG